MINQQKIQSALKNASIKLDGIDSILIRDGQIGVIIHPSLANEEQQIQQIISQMDGVEKVTIVQTDHIQPPPKAPQKPSPQPLAGVKHIIAVGSGKGGVGKSTIALNLAIALQQLGQKVGLVDADIHGPSIAHMIGIKTPPESHDTKIIPHQAFGISCLSMGMLIADDAPVIWRGPMISKALNQLMAGADWSHHGDLDILIIDLPPGTGDIQLSLAQKTKISGVVLVATSQEMALLDVKKAASMFQKMNIPILGTIDNMSYFQDPSGQKHPLFGDKNLSELMDNSAILATLPMLPALAQSSDSATPFVHAQKDHPISQSLRDAAAKILTKL